MVPGAEKDSLPVEGAAEKFRRRYERTMHEPNVPSA